MAKKFTVQGFTGYIHTFQDKNVYALRCDIDAIEQLYNTLVNKYNSVTIYEQQTLLPNTISYYEITCKQ